MNAVRLLLSAGDWGRLGLTVLAGSLSPAQPVSAGRGLHTVSPSWGCPIAVVSAVLSPRQAPLGAWGWP